MTICDGLKLLYRGAVANDRHGDARIIQSCYIMAKKMNRELVKVKHGELPVIKNNSWNELDWYEELKEVIK